MSNTTSGPLSGLPLLPVGTPLVDGHNTFGVTFIGGVTSIGLLGMTLMQAWFYYGHFPKDPLWIKVLVVLTCIVEFIRSTLTIHAAYFYLVRNWGNPAGLQAVVWSQTALIVMTSLNELMCHVYFSWRVYKFSPPRNKLRYGMTGMVAVLSLASFVLGIVTYVDAVRVSSVAKLTARTQTVLIPFSLGVAIAADISLSACLIFVLTRTKTLVSRMNRVLNAFIFYAIQVGALTVLTDVAVLVLNEYITNPKIQYAYGGVYAVVGNLYANSFLATLNARSALAHDMDSDGTSYNVSTSFRVAGNGRPGGQSSLMFGAPGGESSRPTITHLHTLGRDGGSNSVIGEEDKIVDGDDGKVTV